MAKLPQINHNNNTSSSTNILLSSTWGIRTSFQVLIMILITLVISVLYFTQDSDGLRSLSPSSSPLPSSPREEHDDVVRDTMEEVQIMMQKCDYFSGKWVFDNKTYPLYKEKECSFMSDQLACEKFGRKDLSYQYWRWQPHHCDLLRYFFFF